MAMTLTESEFKLVHAVFGQPPGQLDFQKLADELGLSTKKIAYEKYRIFKEKLDALSPSDAAPEVKKVTPAKATPSKKRKIEEAAVEDEDAGAVMKYEGAGEQVGNAPTRYRSPFPIYDEYQNRDMASDTIGLKFRPKRATKVFPTGYGGGHEDELPEV